MVAIYGYHDIGKLYESSITLVHRVLSHQEEQPVVVKCLKRQAVTAENIKKYQHEFDILQKLQIEGCIKVFGLNNLQLSPFLILEDIGGKSLMDHLTDGCFQLKEVIEIAVKIVVTLRGIHQNNIIHKDLCPANIIYNSHTGVLRIIDFAGAADFYDDTIQSTDPGSLEGTLAYISPEQTGRMNRPVDYEKRGQVFFWLLWFCRHDSDYFKGGRFNVKVYYLI